MVKLYTSADRVMLGALRTLLENQGIACLVKNELLGGGAGGLPLNDCWPEIWLHEEADLPRARRLLDEALRPDLSGRYGWSCPGCGESLEAQFEQCWNCGHWR